MGNHSSAPSLDFALLLDNNGKCRAGEVLTGRVVLSIDRKKLGSRNEYRRDGPCGCSIIDPIDILKKLKPDAKGVSLVFRGEEYVEVTEKVSHVHDAEPLVHRECARTDTPPSRNRHREERGREAVSGGGCCQSRGRNDRRASRTERPRTSNRHCTNETGRRAHRDRTHVNDGSTNHQAVCTKGFKTEKSLHAIIVTEFPLIIFNSNWDNLHSYRDMSSVDASSNTKFYKYIFPFEYMLPDYLPSSMKYEIDDGKTMATVRYNLSAFLDESCQTDDLDTKFRVTHEVDVIASNATQYEPKTPVTVEQDLHMINTCCCFRKGHMFLGFRMDADVGHPNSTFEVNIEGENHSKFKIDYFSVRCVESISFRTHNKLKRNGQRTIGECKVPVDVSVHRHWDSPCRRGNGNVEPLLHAGRDNASVVANLRLSPGARDSFSGHLLQVHHSVIVTPRLSRGVFTASPELSCSVRLVRDATNSQERLRPSGLGNCSCSGSATHQSIGRSLGNNSQSRQEARQRDIGIGSFIAEATAVALDEDDAWSSSAAIASVTMPTNVHRNFASATAPVEPPPPTAPHERSTPSANSHNLHKLHLMIASLSNDDLKVAVHEAEWASFIETLSPKDLATTIQTAGHKGVAVARTFAPILNSSLSCRHILACLYILPESPERRSIVRQLAPFASDLPQNLSLLDAELDEYERLELRKLFRI